VHIEVMFTYQTCKRGERP